MSARSVVDARDPFDEREVPRHRCRLRILGATVEFESDSEAWMALVEQAFGGLPAHEFSGGVPTLRVRLRLSRASAPLASPPPVPRLSSGGDLLTAHVDAHNFAVIAPACGTALVQATRAMLRRPYHLRYELLEFAVLTLGARAQGLVPLHAACVAMRDRGLLLMGDSGAGKTTASLQALLAGLEFVAEDSVFVHPRELRATGVASFLHVRAGGRRAGLPPGFTVIRRRSGVRKVAIDLRSAGVRVARRAPRVTALIILSPLPARSEPLLTPLSSKSLAARLRALQPYATAHPEWARFERRLRTVPTYLARRAPPGELAQALRTLLEWRRAPQ